MSEENSLGNMESDDSDSFVKAPKNMSDDDIDENSSDSGDEDHTSKTEFMKGSANDDIPESDEDVDKSGSDSHHDSKTEDEQFNDMRNQLLQMPFEELEKLKDKIGMKMYNQALFGVQKTGEKVKKQTFKRENKNRPMEISSKKRPKKVMQVVPTKKKVHRDPRFDDLSGEFSQEHFNKAYSFLKDVKGQEKQKLIAKSKKIKDPEKKKQLEQLLMKMNQEEMLTKKQNESKKKIDQRKKVEKELVKEGKRPYFLKKSAQRTLELADKYKELKEKGGLDKYLSKKRKKNASKDRRKLPN